MQSIIDVSTAVHESRGIKRTASPTFPCLSSSTEHQQSLVAQYDFSCHNDQLCYYKRPRISDQHPSILSQKTPTPITFPTAANSILWPDYRSREIKMDQETHRSNYEASYPEDLTSNFIAKTDLPFASTHHNKPGIESRRPGEYFNPQNRLHTFFTKASINTPKGVVQLERVLVDGRSLFNLVPRSIAANLDLTLYPGRTLSITIAQRLIQIKQYSQFTIRIAGHNTRISAGVVSGLQTIMLGHEWIRSVHLLSDIDNRNYYIPTLLAAEVVGENIPDILDTRIEANGTGDDDDEEVVDDDNVTEVEDQDEEVSGDGDVSEDDDGEGFSDKEDFSEGDNDEKVDDGEEFSDECEGWEKCDGFAECERCENCDGNGNEEYEEQAFPGSQQTVMHEGSAIVNTTGLEANKVQNSITERQSKLTANILNHMSRTQAGQSFKAPVEQLWPDLAGAYAAKVPNPIDLDTIQANLKNNLYSSMDDIRADINLLHQNSADFNGINHTITSTALEVRNTILEALEAIEAGESGVALRA